MNLTRRNILKALGIGAAVSVSGASIAKETNNPNISWEEAQKAGWLMDQQSVPFQAWGKNVTYKRGEMIKASDGMLYESKETTRSTFAWQAENVIEVKDGEWPVWATPDRIARGAYIIGPDKRHYRFPW